MIEDDREIDVPPDIEAGVWANDVEAFGDLEDVTLDFIRMGPRNPRTGVVVARVTFPLSCIIKLEHELGPFR